VNIFYKNEVIEKIKEMEFSKKLQKPRKNVVFLFKMNKKKKTAEQLFFKNIRLSKLLLKSI